MLLGAAENCWRVLGNAQVVLRCCWVDLGGAGWCCVLLGAAEWCCVPPGAADLLLGAAGWCWLMLGSAG